jgi:hypothetical protein
VVFSAKTVETKFDELYSKFIFYFDIAYSTMQIKVKPKPTHKKWITDEFRLMSIHLKELAEVCKSSMCKEIHNIKY